MKMKTSIFLSFISIFILLSISIPLEIHAQVKQVNPAIQKEIDSLKKKVIDLQNNLKEYEDIDKRLKEAEENLSKYDVEKLATEKLVEISTKNLMAPNFIWYVIAGIIPILIILWNVIKYRVENAKGDLKNDIIDELSKFNEKQFENAKIGLNNYINEEFYKHREKQK
jgi:hypothetical protein